MGKRSDNPCYECGERVVGCHSKCSRHLKWKREYREEVESLSKDELARYVGSKSKVGKV